MDEMFEILTWAQLQIHKKPCGFLNVNGYYNKLFGFIDHMISEGFIMDDCRSLLELDDQPDGLLAKFRRFTPLTVDKGEWAKKLVVEKNNIAKETYFKSISHTG